MMAGIYIPGMEIPKGDSMIVAIRPDGMIEDVMGCFVGKAVSVPKHGRLIDADVLFDRMEFEIKHFVPTDEFSRGVLSGYRSAARASRYASTIIPAEPPKEEQ